LDLGPTYSIGPKGLLARAVRSFAHAAFGNAASFALAFVFAGLTIRFLGNDRSGYLLLLQSVLGLNAVVSQGIGAPAIRQLAKYRARNDLPGTKDLVASLLSLGAIVGGAWAAALVVAFPILAHWSQLDLRYVQDARNATWLTAFAFCVAQASATANTVFQGYERYDFISGLNAGFGLLNGVASIAVLSFHPTMTAVTLVTVAVTLLRLPVEFALVRSTIGHCPSFGWSARELRPLARFGLWTASGSIGGVLFASVDRLVLSAFLGARALPYYSIAQRLFAQVHSALGSQAQFLLPLLAGSHGDTASETARVDDRLRWYLASLGVLFYGGIGILAMVLLARIVGGPLAPSDRIPIVFACIQGVMHATMIVPYYETWALGKAAPNAIAHLANGILAVATMFALIPVLGVIGASIAQLWIGPVACVHGIWTARELYRENSVSHWASPLITPAIAAVPWLVGFAFLMHSSAERAPAVVLLASTVASILSLYGAERIFFRDKMRLDTVVRAVRLVLNRRKRDVRGEHATKTISRSSD
jgi:O-antigen/teichoic acid export membrane protein